MKGNESNNVEEWVGMPEFVQEKQEPYSCIRIRFADKEDLQEFAEMIGQKLTEKTKSIWHPKLVRGINSNKRYASEDESILKKIGDDALDEYFELCQKYRCFDIPRARKLANEALKYYKANSKGRTVLAESQEIENRWYESLKTNPDYSLYDDEYYIIEIWACWVVYSRQYILMLQKISDRIKNIKSIADLGCGFGYTSAALNEVFPDATVTGTNIESTTQFAVAKEISNKYNFKVQPMVTEKANLIFASEYFEHIENPIDHLLEIVDICQPSYLVIANAFSAKSMGHFDHYLIDGKPVENKKVGRIFNKKLRELGYAKLDTGFWNDRPTIWSNES